MKKILLVVAVVFVVNSAYSQKTRWGIKAGGNLSSISDELTQKDGSGELFGVHTGVFANVSCGNAVSFQPELLFSVQGGRNMRVYPNMLGGIPPLQHLVFKLNYVQLPLLFEIKPIANTGILAGAQLGLNVTRKVTATYFDEFWNLFILYNRDHTWVKSVTKSGSDFDDYIFDDGGLKKFDFAMVFGLQYTIQRVTIGARYNLGLVNGYKYTNTYGYTSKGWKSNVIQAGLGFSF